MESEFLLIDISNSFTKIAFSSKHKLGRISKLATSALNAAGLNKFIGKHKYRHVVFSCVVPEKTKTLLRFFKNKSMVEVNHKCNLGVGIDYPDPKTIGEDRLANAAGAVAFYGAPVVVVDFGTAVTFDIISPDKKYIGGVIAPGLEVMTDYLYQRTALLPKIDLSEPVSAIGKSTRKAMMAGAIYGYRGLVKQILLEIKREIGSTKKVKVVATGGYAELIAHGMREIQNVHPNLTLEGLRMIGNLNTENL